ncbi:MAG: SGNH/GDSL hydrolase family protein [Verrucomicrobia bacterium]|nr:SGNH/GDSL hydrolase family protein [Verrucomicrobiota bacterium]
MARRGQRVAQWMSAILLLMAAGFLLGAYLFWWRLPVGSGPAGHRVPSVPFGKPWTPRPVLLVGLGDSITAGFGASRGRSYFSRLQTNPPGEFGEMQGLCLASVFPRLASTNLAISGSTSLQCLRTELPRLAVQASNVVGVVVLTTGGNDLIHNYGRTAPSEGAMYGATRDQAQSWIENFRGRLDAIVTAIEARFPGGCAIFLADIYDPTDGTGNARRVGLPPWPDAVAVLSAYNQVIADCASRHPSVHRVNLHDPFLGHGLYCRQFWRTTYRPEDPFFWYQDILEDPNDRGHDAIRRQFLITMAEVLPPALAGDDPTK